MSSYTAGLHKLCVLWICLPGFSQVSEGQCLDGFTSHDGQCYLYIQNQYNWFEAQVACWSMGARLVEVDSIEKSHFITNFLKGRGGKSAWIGVTDMAVETEWAESSPYKEGFDLCSLWGKTEPNNYGGKEDCAFIDGWQWLDHGCHSGQHSVMCEMLGSFGGMTQYVFTSSSSQTFSSSYSQSCPNKISLASSNHIRNLVLLQVLLSTAVGLMLAVCSY